MIDAERQGRQPIVSTEKLNPEDLRRVRVQNSAELDRHSQTHIRGSRSFGAKNNDPLEVFVFTRLLERLFWLGRSVGHKPQRWRRKPCSRAKYHAKRGQNQGFSSTVLTANSRIIVSCMLATGTLFHLLALICKGFTVYGVHSEYVSLPFLNRSTRDSYTRCHGHADIARLRVLPVYQCCVS
jgi:hypothetical protein